VRGYHKEGWPSGIYGLAEMNAEPELVTQENPFVDRSVFGAGTGHDLDMAVRVTNRASRNYGKWKTHEECADLQQALKALDREGTGRVRLLDFYKKDNVSGNWFLEEQQDYLRDMGTLDESNSAIGPKVIIPNYVQDPSICLKVSSFYEVCCLRRCETILSRIEREIQHPSAEPVQILKVVQEFIGDRAGIFERQGSDGGRCSESSSG
jgi:hypothetical protein